MSFGTGGRSGVQLRPPSTVWTSAVWPSRPGSAKIAQPSVGELNTAILEITLPEREDRAAPDGVDDTLWLAGLIARERVGDVAARLTQRVVQDRGKS